MFRVTGRQILGRLNFHSCWRLNSRLMSNASSEPESSERANKRRRIMASTTETQAPDMPLIELSKAEENIRSLLLDVAKQGQQKRASAEGKPSEATTLRFTGGWVRDKILGVGSQDIDVGISDMTGYQFGLALQEYLATPSNKEWYVERLDDKQGKRGVGLHKIEANPERSKNLETCKTKIFGLEVDLVNLRKEVYNEDSRNPQMDFGTAQEDALRRDATVNALFYNLHTASVEDFTGRGLQDMKDGIICTPLAPYKTFRDDPLRVLRLIRFASRLGYRIDQGVQEAMQSEDVKSALRIKISRERVGIELDKMLRGPDPLDALRYIDRLGLYNTVFTNFHDDTPIDSTNWHRAYTTVHAILNDDYKDVGIPLPQRASIRRLLICNDEEKYYSWVVAALSPWAIVPHVQSLKKLSWPAMVARDSLRCDNKLLRVLTPSALYHQTVTDMKTAFLNNELGSSVPDIRWRISAWLRTLGKDWRHCILQAMLLEIMQGAEAADVCRDYAKLLLYVEEQDLLEVHSLRPFIDGCEVSKAMGGEKGPWMAKAMEMIVEWNVRNPGRQDGEEAISSVIARKAELGLQ